MEPCPLEGTGDAEVGTRNAEGGTAQAGSFWRTSITRISSCLCSAPTQRRCHTARRWLVICLTRRDGRTHVAPRMNRCKKELRK
jgi:hypothetical protein